MRFCLVSALRTTGRWDVPANEIRAWATAFEGDVHDGWEVTDGSRFDAYDLTMIELTHPMLPVAERICQESRTKVVGLTEGDLMPHWPAPDLSRYVQVLNMVDYVGIINAKAEGLMRALTQKPVVVIGIPYPVQWTKDHRRDRHNGLVELGSPPPERYGIWNAAALRKARVPGICYHRGEEDATLAKELLPDITLHPMTDWQSYFIHHSGNRIGLHLDGRSTWGRFPLDCAAAGMPCISTRGSQTQSILFPNLTLEYYQIEEAAALVRRLLEDDRFYRDAVAHAEAHLSFFDLGPTRQRLLSAL